MTGLIAHLAHVEILTPHLDGSVEFFRDLIGMEVVDSADDSVALRTWGEYLPYNLVLRRAETSALGHVAWRTRDAAALDEAVSRLEQEGVGLGWTEASARLARSYAFLGPSGQRQLLFAEAEPYVAPAHLASALPSRPQRNPARGVSARYLDHVNYPAGDILGDAAWYERVLGIELTEWTEIPEAGVAIFATLSTGSAFELALLRDDSGIPGRFHHFALMVDERADVIRAAELFREAGVPIEWGPGRHGHGESMSVYVREPGGMRVEIVSVGLVRRAWGQPAVKWSPSDGSADFYLSNPLPEVFLEVLPVMDASASTIDVAGQGNPWGTES